MINAVKMADRFNLRRDERAIEDFIEALSLLSGKPEASGFQGDRNGAAATDIASSMTDVHG
ncbi:hypothetical protein [Pseudoxanthomonas sp. PXM01]|uniref:hypothetical protein n=1 Tax=Pseudoxanthomonas sp. PXM01 TaxID=2769295 RepID=UPI001781533F|nr:hypothetical protein [Pseudoxanthomonas sp. PXM01]MBD9470659.1 hypothetical protein [Pseudoxanthomonas sp. PXM01]